MPQQTAPNFVRKFYDNPDNVNRLNGCIESLVWNYNHPESESFETPVTHKPVSIERQTLSNAPIVDMSKSIEQLTSARARADDAVTLGRNMPSEGTHGKIQIAWNMNEGLQLRAYIHELGVILDYRNVKGANGTNFGYKPGLGDPPDPDSGAALEYCFFGNMDR